MLNVVINGKNIQGKQGQTVLQICQDNNIYIPTLCHHPDLPASGKCGLCIVKIDQSTFVHACMQPARDSMSIETKSDEIIKKAQMSLSRFVNTNQPPEDSFEIEEICRYLNPKNSANRFREADRTNSITFDPTCCIGCGRCNRACSDLMSVNALNDINPRMRTNGCISCGQCIQYCPTSALVETSSISAVLKAIVSNSFINNFNINNTNNNTNNNNNNNININKKIVVLQIAPAVRVSIGELFGDPIGTICTGKIITAARQMGFSYILDTCFGADVMVVEESAELVDRIRNNGVLPLFTSCCPAWVNYVEQKHSELIPNLSSARSPHMIVGRLVKSYFAEKMRIKDPNNIFLVSLMPCVAKKDEIKRMQLIGDVDAVITTREFQILCENFGIEWSTLKDGEFDSLLGLSSGSGNLFGVSGGVSEAAVRYTYETLTNKKLDSSFFAKNVRNSDPTNHHGSIKKVKIPLNHLYSDLDLNNNDNNKSIDGNNSNNNNNDNNENMRVLKVAVCNGMRTAINLIESKKYKKYDFIEVMACPSGCIGGGGQPKLREKSLCDLRKKALYQIDAQKSEMMIASENVEVQLLYRLYLNNNSVGRTTKSRTAMLHTHHEPHEIASSYASNIKKQIQDSLPYVGFGSSSSGTAMRYARMVGGFLQTISGQLNSMSIDALKARRLAVFVVSTVNDGEFPTNCQKFVNELRETNSTLEELRYCVLGLGSSKYAKEKFCLAGRQLDLLLEEHKAKKICDFFPIDTSSYEGGMREFEKWSKKICDLLNMPPPKIGVRLLYGFQPDPDDSIVKNPLRPLTFEKMKVKSREKLTIEGYDLEYIKYTIKLPSGMAYQAGGHALIFPSNPIDVAKECMKAMNFAADQVFQVKSDAANKDNFIPEKVTSEQLFVQYIDLLGKPNKALLRSFLRSSSSSSSLSETKVTENENEKTESNNVKVEVEEGVRKLQKLLELGENSEEIEKYFSSNNVANVIKEFSKYGVPSMARFVSSCPLIYPRTYSIASSPVKSRGTLSIIVSTEKFTISTILKNKNIYINNNNEVNDNDKIRLGLCSQFLKNEETKRIPLRIDSNKNGFIDPKCAPVIYVATGRGVASILGSFEQREHTYSSNNGEIGRALLFFGCRNKKGFQPLVNQLDEFKGKSIVDDIYYAFSRDDPSSSLSSSSDNDGGNNINKFNTNNMVGRGRVHVQDVMKKHMAELWELWQDPTCILMYAGLEATNSSSVSEDMRDIMLQVTQLEGELSVEDALEFNDGHQFIFDIYE